jgi:hypothetical protein
MAAGQKIKGKDGIIEMTVDATTEEIPCLTSWTLDVQATINEDTTSCMLSNGDGGSAVGGDWTESEVESKNWSLSAEHVWQKDDTVGTTGMLDATDVGAKCSAVLYPNNKTGAGNRTYSGDMILESVSITSETASTITTSSTFKGTGALTKGVTVA